MLQKKRTSYRSGARDKKVNKPRLASAEGATRNTWEGQVPRIVSSKCSCHDNEDEIKTLPNSVFVQMAKDTLYKLREEMVISCEDRALTSLVSALPSEESVAHAAQLDEARAEG